MHVVYNFPFYMYRYLHSLRIAQLENQCCDAVLNESGHCSKSRWCDSVGPTDVSGAGKGHTAPCKHVCTVFYAASEFCRFVIILPDLKGTQVKQKF